MLCIRGFGQNLCIIEIVQARRASWTMGTMICTSKESWRGIVCIYASSDWSLSEADGDCSTSRANVNIHQCSVSAYKNALVWKCIYALGILPRKYSRTAGVPLCSVGCLMVLRGLPFSARCLRLVCSSPSSGGSFVMELLLKSSSVSAESWVTQTGTCTCRAELLKLSGLTLRSPTLNQYWIETTALIPLQFW